MAEPEVVTSDPVPARGLAQSVGVDRVARTGKSQGQVRHDNISQRGANDADRALAGVGGSATYAVIAEPGGAGLVVVAFAAACVYLIALSILLVWECMMFESYPALSQDPANLMQPEFGLDALREVELENLSKRILDATAINNRRAKEAECTSNSCCADTSRLCDRGSRRPCRHSTSECPGDCLMR